MLIKPFKGLRPTAEFASDVIAPPYDVLSSAEAKLFAKDKPLSFLHISKPEIDLADDVDVYSDIVYQTGKNNFNKLLKDHILAQDDRDCFYAYRLSMGETVQTGLVAAASVAAYNNNLIKKHEFTRPKKETDRVKQIDALQAQTGPVFLTCRDNATINQLLQQVTSTAAVYDLEQAGVRHEIWVINQTNNVAELNKAFNDLDCLYVADGHHRSAAASRVAELHQENDNAQFFLSVIFPASELKILDYNRVIKDLNGLSVNELLTKLATHFTVEQTQQAIKPTKKAQYAMYLDGSWYQLTYKNKVDISDAIASLDISILDKAVIKPLFNIQDPRLDDRIDFVGGIRGLDELQRRVDSGEMAVAFALYPTAMEELLAVADKGEVMPPKSTWFEPKLADGLISYCL